MTSVTQFLINIWYLSIQVHYYFIIYFFKNALSHVFIWKKKKKIIMACWWQHVIVIMIHYVPQLNGITMKFSCLWKHFISILCDTYYFSIFKNSICRIFILFYFLLLFYYKWEFIWQLNVITGWFKMKFYLSFFLMTHKWNV